MGYIPNEIAIFHRDNDHQPLGFSGYTIGFRGLAYFQTNPHSDLIKSCANKGSPLEDSHNASLQVMPRLFKNFGVERAIQESCRDLLNVLDPHSKCWGIVSIDEVCSAANTILEFLKLWQRVWHHVTTLWWTYKKLLKMTIEIVDFPVKNGGSFYSYVNVYQRVNRHNIEVQRLPVWKFRHFSNPKSMLAQVHGGCNHSETIRGGPHGVLKSWLINVEGCWTKYCFFMANWYILRRIDLKHVD